MISPPSRLIGDVGEKNLFDLCISLPFYDLYFILLRS